MMIRAASRRALTTFLSRNYNSSNQQNFKESANQGRSDASDNEPPFFDLDEYRLAKWAESIGILGSMFILGLKLHSNVCHYKSITKKQNNEKDTCSFLVSLFSSIPKFSSQSSYGTLSSINSVLPQHFCSSSSDSTSKSQADQSKGKNIQGKLDPWRVSSDSNFLDVFFLCSSKNYHCFMIFSFAETLEQLCAELRSEMDLFSDEYKNLQAMILIENNKVKEAINLLKSCPKSAKAMFNLGLVYELGKNDPVANQPSYTEAVKYYLLASSLGHDKASYNLGLIYLYGKGSVELDKDKAFKFLQQAASMGVKEAQEFVNHENKILQKRHQRISQAERLLKINLKPNNNKFHTSRSSPSFITNLVSFVQPPFEVSPLETQELKDMEGYRDESFYQSTDSGLEVVFTQE